MPCGGKRLTLHQKDTLRSNYARATEPIPLTQVCEWARQEFGCIIHKATASRILRDARSSQAFHIDDQAATDRHNLKLPRYPELDQELASWVRLANENNVCTTGRLLKRKAEAIAQTMGIGDSFRASQGWLHKFQMRHHLWVHRLHGESASTDSAVVKRGRSDLLSETSLFEAADVYNMDETAIFFKAQPKTSISSKPVSGIKRDKTRISVALTSNATGSHKLPLLFIGRAMRPRCFGNLTSEQLSLYYRSNRRAWMTIALFSEWIMKFNDEMKSEGRHVLLLLDNASSHQVVTADVSNVRVVMLPPNTTSVLQPMDAGIIAAFKQYYNRRQTDHAMRIVDDLTAGVDVPVEPRKNPYAVDILQAMTWSTEAWDEVSSRTIRNCWEHTGILPSESLMGSFDRLRLQSAASLDLLLS